MGILDPGKLLVVLVIALIVLGPERLPRLARQAGAAWRELTRVREQVTEEIRSAMPDIDLPNIPRMPTNMVSGFIADLTKPSVSGAGAEAAGASVASEVDGSSDELASYSTGDDTPLLGSTATAGDLGREGQPWGAASGRHGAFRSRGAAVAEPSFGELPLVADDPSMN